MQWIGSLRLTIFKMNNSKLNSNERKFLKLAYQSLKRQFNGISKIVGYGLISLKMKKWDLTTSKNKLNGTKISPACKTRHITWARI